MMDTQKVASWLFDISLISGILTNDKYTVSGHLGQYILRILVNGIHDTKSLKTKYL